MNRSIWKSMIVIFVIVLLSVVFLKSGYTVVAEPPPSTIPQATAVTGPAEPGVPGTSSQGTEAQLMPARGEPLDNPAILDSTAATAHFYHIPGSVLTPVDSATSLAYDSMGCIHATAGAAYLLNAPLEIPDGSRIVLMRLYYDDTSASTIDSWITRYDELGTTYQDLVGVDSIGTAGHGSNYGDLDHIVDTYGWSYVLNVRLNASSSALQVCGFRVMYYPPSVCCSYVPAVMRNVQP